MAAGLAPVLVPLRVLVSSSDRCSARSFRAPCTQPALPVNRVVLAPVLQRSEALSVQAAWQQSEVQVHPAGMASAAKPTSTSAGALLASGWDPKWRSGDCRDAVDLAGSAGKARERTLPTTSTGGGKAAAVGTFVTLWEPPCGRGGRLSHHRATLWRRAPGALCGATPRPLFHRLRVQRSKSEGA